MSSYLSSIVIAAGIVALASLFVPDGKNKRWVSFLFSLVAFTVIAAPLLQLDELKELASSYKISLGQQASEAEHSADEVVIKAAEQALAQGLADALGISVSSVNVDIFATNEGGSWLITKITASISVPFHEKAAWAYLKEAAPKDCEVMVLGG